MGLQIIKQPNNKYCIFSSIVDTITHYNMSEQDIINDWVEDANKEIELKVKEIISKLNADEKPYFQFTKTFEEMLKCIEQVHGAEEVNQIKNLIDEK